MAESSNFGLGVLPEGPRALLIQSKVPESSLNFSPCSLESPKAPAGAWLEHWDSDTGGSPWVLTALI